jgi:hypothetical protein
MASLACGKRGDPLPPLRRFPEAVQQIRVWQQGPFIYLEWSAPNRNTDGSAEVELEEALILRRLVEIPEPVVAEVEDSGGEEGPESEISDSVSPEQPGAAEEEAEQETPAEPEAPAVDTPPPVEGEEPKESESADESGAQDETGAQEVGKGQAPQPAAPPFPAGAEEIAALESAQVDELLTFRDPWDPSWEGKRVEYAVRHINRKGRRSGLSLVVHIDPLPPVEPPKDLATEVEAGLVRLRWSSELEEVPSAEEEGAVSFGYNVYRRGETELFPSRPLNATALPDSSYEDRNVVFGQPWCYAVRRVVVSEEAAGGAKGPVIESVDSEEACLTPIDTFPPPVPEDVVAVTSTEGVLLSWGTVVAPDLKGYLVYRAVESEGPFEPLTDEPLTAASYTDRSAESGEVYFYVVSAVDQVEPWNESPRSEPVSIRVPRNP